LRHTRHGAPHLTNTRSAQRLLSMKGRPNRRVWQPRTTRGKPERVALAGQAAASVSARGAKRRRMTEPCLRAPTLGGSKCGTAQVNDGTARRATPSWRRTRAGS
jgi:hypothetical protein